MMPSWMRYNRIWSIVGSKVVELEELGTYLEDAMPSSQLGAALAASWTWRLGSRLCRGYGEWIDDYAEDADLSCIEVQVVKLGAHTRGGT